MGKSERCSTVTCSQSPLQNWKGARSSAAVTTGSSQLSAEETLSRACPWLKRAALPNITHDHPLSTSPLHLLAGHESSAHFPSFGTTMKGRPRPRVPVGSEDQLREATVSPHCSTNSPPLWPTSPSSQVSFPKTLPHTNLRISEAQGTQPVASRIIWVYVSWWITTFILSEQTLQ